MIVAAFCGLAALGALLRWQLSSEQWRNWPVGTFAANISAAFALGLLNHSSPDTVTLAGVAFLGSYSTFSTVIREVVDDDGDAGRGVAYLTATLVLGIAAAYAGLRM